MPTQKKSINSKNKVSNSTNDFGIITLISALCTLLIFIVTLIYYSYLEQLIALILLIGFAVGFILNSLKLKKATRLYMTIYPPTSFMVLNVLIGGFFGQAAGFLTMIFLSFIVYRKNPKLRIIIVVYDILAYIFSTIYISIYGPILGIIDLPYDEILVFIACLAWLSLTFRMYDETKTRTYTNALEKNNKKLKISELELKKTQSELKDQNHKLSLLNQELFNKNKKIEEFTFIVTHDLKSPLNNINVIAKELQKKALSPKDEDFEIYCKHLEGTSKRMTDLVHGLLEYAEIGDSFNMETVDCNNVVKNILLDLSEDIKKSNAKIVCNELPKIIGRERDIRMLFQNLIHNAIKFTPKDISPQINISSENIPGFYQFKIEDNGIGIPKDQLENIFKAFNRLNDQSEFEGSGIGLYGCKRVVDIHKGEIWVESEEGKGSTFYFTICSNLTKQQSNHSTT